MALIANASLAYGAAICANPDDTVNGVSWKLLKTPISLQNNLGNSKATLHNASDLELGLYRQGWNHVHNFMYVDAIRSFHTALLTNSDVELRLSLVAAYVELGVIAEAKTLLSEVQKNLISSNPNIKALKLIVELLKYLLGDETVDKSVINNSKATLKELESLVDFQLYFAFQIWDEEVILENYNGSKSSAAQHYLTHMKEGKRDSIKAEKFAREYAENAKASAHAQHMHGHVLPLLGRWAESIVKFRQADQLHLQWQRSNKAKPEDDWHYGHNLDLLSAAYFHTKQPQLAEATYKRLCDVKPFENTCYQLVEYYLATNKLKEANEVLWMYYVAYMPDAFGEKRMDSVVSLRANILRFEIALRSNEQKINLVKEAKEFVTKIRESELYGKISDELMVLEFYLELTKFASPGSGQNGKDIEAKIVEKMKTALSSPGFDGWSRGAVLINRIVGYAELLKVDFASSLRQQYQAMMKVP